MSKITDYPSATEIGAGDVILLDGSKGTQKATGKVAADSFGKLYNSLTYGDQTSYLVVDKKTVNVQSGWCRIYESGGVGTGFWENIGAFFEISCNIRNQEVHSVYLSSIEAGVCKFKPHYDISRVHRLKKLRTYKSDTNVLCIDLYFDGFPLNDTNSNNTVIFSNIPLSGFAKSQYQKSNFKDFEPVSDSIQKTNLAEYEFKANSWMGSSDVWPLS